MMMFEIVYNYEREENVKQAYRYVFQQECTAFLVYFADGFDDSVSIESVRVLGK